MKNHMDAEDIVHETFLKYYHLDRTFDSEQHKKAWLIVTASNACKDMLKHWWNRRNRLEDFTEIAEDSHSEIDGMMSLILELPYQYKMVVYLYYYEGYNSREIADLLHKSESTIRTRLQKAKKILRKEFKELSKMSSLWTRSYFVSTEDFISLDTIKWYVEQQKTRG